MHAIKIFSGLGLLLALNSLNAFAQEFTLTTTAANTVSSKSSIDMPGLTGNPLAIIVATPVGNTEKLNPHSIGAWYYNDKWHIFNTDHANMPPGLQFKVQVFLKPDANHFLHLVNEQNLVGGSSFIDNPALNNNPNAQFTIFLNHAPDHRSASLNKYTAQAVYDPTADKWAIKNAGGERLYPNAAYNIVLTSGGTATTINTTLPTATPYLPVVPMTIATAPLSVVVRTEVTLPNIGLSLPMGYCRTPVAVYENPDIRITDSVTVTGQHADGFEELRWSATTSNGSVKITVCHNLQGGYLKQLNISYRKVNILVLR